jgi:thiamine-phosphate pyrophosphorylase
VDSFPYYLYLVIDPDLCLADPINLAETGIENGVDIIQLRYKGKDISFFHRLAGQLRQVTQKLNVPLIINDRVDICLCVNADGVHLGQDDLPVEAARNLLGENKIIGLSTHNLEQARKAHNRPVDYIGLGPVFATASKKDHDSVIGLDLLGDIFADIRIPCFAIGGISPDNIKMVTEAGAGRVAVVTAITRADDPARVSRTLKFALESKK